MKNTLFKKDFTLMILGQIISLFGNAILRFTLSLYILDTTGSATIFAMILALSILPTILLSPIGGILADRINRKKIMIVLDLTSAFIIFSFILLTSKHIPIITIAFVMIALSIIQTCYQPAVEASLPLLCSSEQLIKANSIVIQINALANLLGPILGGMLYSFLPLDIILWIDGFSFFFSAILECFLHIPQKKVARMHTLTKTFTGDLKEGMQFVIKQRPILYKLLLVLALLNLVLSCLFSVGLPYISNVLLGLPAQFYGWLQSGSAIGSIIGSLLIGFFHKKLKLNSSYKFLGMASLCLFPLSFSILSLDYKYVSFMVIFIFSLITTIFVTAFNIYVQTYIQTSTPNEMLGKVSSFVTVIVMCSYPIGQAIYGILFDTFAQQAYGIVLLAAILSLAISYKTKNIVKKL